MTLTIREFRQKRRLTVSDFAILCGISEAYAWKLEQDTHPAQAYVRTIVYMSEFLNDDSLMAVLNDAKKRHFEGDLTS